MNNIYTIEDTYNVIVKLRNTSSTNEKLNILKSNVDNDVLTDILYYTYNPFLMYGISERVYDMTTYEEDEYHGVNFFLWLENLAQSNINDYYKRYTKGIIETHNENVQDLYKCMLFKDLKIGVNAKSINKVWEDLIPTFDVMLAESLHKQKEDFLDGKQFAITEKLDGFRLVYLPNSKKFMSRQGQELEGLDHLIPECEEVSKGIYVLDGELIHRNYDNLKSDELYRLTTSVARKKGATKEKKHLEFHLFDVVPQGEFAKGKSIDGYEDRHYLLNRLIRESNNLDFVKQVPWLYIGDDVSVIHNLLDEMVEQGSEGLMVSLLDKPYECKRSKNLLKVKQFHDADVLVVDVYEGEKKFKGTLGGLVVKFLYKGEELTTHVGSGFYHSERELFYNNPELIIGRVIETKYFEVSKNKQGERNLRFCTYRHRIREDKNIDEITDVAIV